MAIASPALRSCLYAGSVRHRRLRPVSHQFRYAVCALLIDLDELSTLRDRLPLFSVNRWNVFSFFERDHGPRDGSPLKAWVERYLAANGIELAGGAVRLLCFPRLFGYVFDPLTLWFCYHASGQLKAILLEVRNISGESHGYLLSTPDSATAGRVRARFQKHFYVSAFIGMGATYECDISAPGDRFDVRIREFENGDETLVASWRGARRPLTTARLLAVFVRYPLMTFRITATIYWHALRLVHKRVPRHRRRDASSMPGAVTYVGRADGAATMAAGLADPSAAARAGRQP